MTQKNILAIIHRCSTKVGRVGALLTQQGFELDIRCPMDGDPLPSRLETYDAVVCFGGNMSSNDENLPGIREELDWLPKILKAELPYLGICLGAQLMARVLGAKVKRAPDLKWEVGYVPVKALEEAPLPFAKDMTVFQWHKEGFDIPFGCKKLLAGSNFPNQAYSCGKNVYGLQFHPEVTPAIIDNWLIENAKLLQENSCLPSAQQQRQDIQTYDAHLNQWTVDLLAFWTNLIEEKAPRKAPVALESL